MKFDWWMKSKEVYEIPENGLSEKANSMAVEVYTLTVQFPKYEAHVMIPLLRKLALSVVSNISKALAVREGREFLFFMTYANASANCIIALGTMSRDIGYITNDQLDQLDQKCRGIARELERMISAVENAGDK